MVASPSVERESLAALVSALNAARVRYVVVGGLAVVAHGYLRATADVDLVLALDPENTRRAVAALEDLGYRPTVPVSIRDFAEAAKRRVWREDKGAVVLRLHSDRHPTLPVDLFIDEPFDFAEVVHAALTLEIADGLAVTFVGLEHLLEMKRAAGRPQDVADVHQLERIRARLREEEG